MQTKLEGEEAFGMEGHVASRKPPLVGYGTKFVRFQKMRKIGFMKIIKRLKVNGTNS